MSIVCTTNHALYVRRGDDGAATRGCGDALASFAKLPAGDVLRGATTLRDGAELALPVVRFLARAPNGVGLSAPDAPLDAVADLLARSATARRQKRKPAAEPPSSSLEVRPPPPAGAS